jgi:hypothetical protein
VCKTTAAKKEPRQRNLLKTILQANSPSLAVQCRKLKKPEESLTSTPHQRRPFRKTIHEADVYETFATTGGRKEVLI